MEFELTHNDNILTLTNATEAEVGQLNISLTGRIPHWKFDPRVQRGVWDGRISYFKNDTYAPAGLWGHIEDVCNRFGFDLTIHGIERKFDYDVDYNDFYEWCHERVREHSEISPYDYQIQTAYNIIRNKCCSNELATSGGKTLITFLVFSYLIETGKAQKILMVVPNTDLVIQGYEDFHEYNLKKQDIRIQQIYYGAEKKEGCNIFIGTYQSLVKKGKDFYSEFDVVCVDEMHKTKSTSIKNILGKCPAKRKFGLTGTFPSPDKKFLDYLTITAHTGPLVSKIKASKLQEGGYIADCEINQLRIKYSDNRTRSGLMRLKYSGHDGGKILEYEKDYAQESELRTRFISDLMGKVSKNTLLLFHNINYGKKIYNTLREKYPDKSIFYIDGQIGEDVRGQYRKKMEKGNGKILVASYGTFSTGINIKNLHNIFFLESFKSDYIIRQAIGRGLRNHSGKDKLRLIDIVDDHRLPGKKFKNILLKHGEERVEIYKEEGFKYNIKNIDLKNKYKNK